MNYCSIQDAWGKSNNMSTQMKEYMGNTNNAYNLYSEQKQQSSTVPQEPLTNNQQLNTLKPEELVQLIQLIQKQNNECNYFMDHITKCNVCYSRMQNKFRSPIIEKIYQLIQENRDTLLIILIGIAILLILNLINNIGK